MATARREPHDQPQPEAPPPDAKSPLAPPAGGGAPPAPDNAPPPMEAQGKALPERKDLSGDELAQLERFHDNIMEGIHGGATQDGQLSAHTQGLLESGAEQGGGKAQQLAEASAEIVARALEGNLEKGVELDSAVVLVGAGLVVDELAQVMDQTGNPISEEETAQAAMAMLPLLWEKTQHLNFWTEEEIAAALQEMAQNPQQIEDDVREADPKGADALERMPEEALAQGEPPQGPPADAAPPEQASPPPEQAAPPEQPPQRPPAKSPLR